MANQYNLLNEQPTYDSFAYQNELLINSKMINKRELDKAQKSLDQSIEKVQKQFYSDSSNARDITITI